MDDRAHRFELGRPKRRDQAARHFLLRRRHLLVRDRVYTHDAEVFVCSEHLLWIEAEE